MRGSTARTFLKSLLLPSRLVRSRARPRTRSIALTFDDGPLAGHTNSVVDALHAKGHRATFFVIGERAERLPGILTWIAGHGCEIGNHSYSHRRVSALPLVQLAAEFQRTDAVIRSVTGVTPRYLRPPFGQLSAKLLLYLARHQAQAVLWSAEFGGYEEGLDVAPAAIVDDFAGDEIAPGDIVLLHDTNAHVVEAVPRLLDVMEAHNLKSVTLSELLAPQPPEHSPAD